MMVCLILTHNVIRIYHKSCRRQLSYCGRHVRAVSEFGKKSDAVCGFLAYFCAVFRFSDPPYAPLKVMEYGWGSSMRDVRQAITGRGKPPCSIPWLPLLTPYPLLRHNLKLRDRLDSPLCTCLYRPQGYHFLPNHNNSHMADTPKSCGLWHSLSFF